MKIERIILFCLLFLNCATIFTFSNQNGSDSSSLSGAVATKLVDTYSNAKNKTFSHAQKNKITKSTKAVVRKSAHFLEYFTLGIIFYLLMRNYRISHPVISTIGFVFAFAITDEIHQFFIADRAARLFDVAIDTAGDTVGALISIAIFNPSIRTFEKISYEQFAKDIADDRGLYESFELPMRDTKSTAGYDIYLLENISLKPGETKKIPTGIKCRFQKNEVLLLIVRSSMGFLHNLRLVNQVGIIDADYYDNIDNEGHIWIKIQNEGDKKVTLKKGEAIVQGIFMKYMLTSPDRRLDKQVRSDY
ncbi:MAG TPA: hypothetical protein DCY94_05045 [Firmicutes bacterium]|nr:hypothetical protein [Bacillota bacterium]